MLSHALEFTFRVDRPTPRRDKWVRGNRGSPNAVNLDHRTPELLLLMIRENFSQPHD